MKGGGIDDRNKSPRITAIREGDFLHARLSGFKRKVEKAQTIIYQAAQLGKIGVSLSGGKDSIVLRHLVLHTVPESEVAFFDSGAELKQTYAVMSHYKPHFIYPERSLPEMLRAGGFWGSVATEPGIKIDFNAELIDKPAAKFCQQFDINVQAIGLRADESVGRRINAKVKGELYKIQSGIFHLCPLVFWNVADIWAYVASRELVYNEAYDIMQGLGIPRDHQRVSTYFGSSAAQFGRYAYLKKIDPELFNRFASEFPRIRSYV